MDRPTTANSTNYSKDNVALELYKLVAKKKEFNSKVSTIVYMYFILSLIRTLIFILCGFAIGLISILFDALKIRLDFPSGLSWFLAFFLHTFIYSLIWQKAIYDTSKMIPTKEDIKNIALKLKINNLIFGRISYLIDSFSTKIKKYRIPISVVIPN